MPEIFLANEPSAARRSTESRPKGQPATSTTEAASGPGSFSRTLQAQIDDRRVSERRATSAERAPDGCQRPADSGAPRADGHRRSESGQENRPAESEPAASAKATHPADAQAESDETDASNAVPILAAAMTIVPPAADAATGNDLPAAIAAKPLSTQTADESASGAPKASAQSDEPSLAGAGTDAEASADDGGRQAAGERTQPAPKLAAGHAQATAATAAMVEPSAPEATQPAERPEVILSRSSRETRSDVTPVRPSEINATSGPDIRARSGEHGPDLQQPAMSNQPIQASIRQASTLSAPTPTAFVSTPAGHPGFADDVGQRVLLFAGRGESKAELILTPPNLGRVEVSLTISAEQATAQFVANSQSARDALEQAMPRLREMLADAGIQLGQSSVGTRSEQQAGDGRQSGRHPFGEQTSISADAATAGVRPWTGTAIGLIDTFA
ncbi:MAG: flagellar hook-length control protein FliK [Rhodocyclaceae bacterium]|nr:flagellar hook-length control protein FliK [Rhodocyclaceae bacterium]